MLIAIIIFDLDIDTTRNLVITRIDRESGNFPITLYSCCLLMSSWIESNIDTDWGCYVIS
jgi:hypothetical protein